MGPGISHCRVTRFPSRVSPHALFLSFAHLAIRGCPGRDIVSRFRWTPLSDACIARCLTTRGALCSPTERPVEHPRLQLNQPTSKRSLDVLKMQVTRKPDSSYASNRLTRSHPPRTHLLSIYNEPSDEPNVKQEVELKAEEKDPAIKEEVANTSDEDDGDLTDMSSDAVDELEPDTDDPVKAEPDVEPKGEELDEEAIYALPASSSEDESDSDAPPRSPEVKKETIDERIAAADRKKSPSSWGGSRGSQNRSLSARKGRLTRTSSNVADNDSDQDEPFRSFTQKPKRSRTNKSYARAKSFTGPPSSSAGAPATPDRQSPEIKPDEEEEKPKKEDRSSAEPQKKIFRMPREVDFDSTGEPKAEGEELFESKDSIFDSTSGSSLETMASIGIKRETPASSPAVPEGPPPPSLCPWCKKEVDPGLLIVFQAQPRQRLREQQQFCASHQQTSAEKEWEARKYPEIDWDSFDERVQEHFPDLEQLLVPDCSSYFRNILDERLRKGKAKNFRLTLAGEGLETISCGYYGTKGAAKM